MDMALLDYCIRDDLNARCNRYMGVLDPLKVTIENYPEDLTEELDFINNPEDETAGGRKVPFSRELYIEREDFQEEPHRKFKRLAPGREVRLRYAYIIKCKEIRKDDEGNVIELICTYDPETRGGNAPDGRKIKGTIHWVSALHAVNCSVRLYDRLFDSPNPLADDDFLSTINSESLEVLEGCMVEPALGAIGTGVPVQFERKGYFCKDPDSTEDCPVWNRTVGLRDTWGKILEKDGKNSNIGK